jgi:alkylhydroperoxidase/carboxymuconolactone decarboxylase family protein YurZ
MGESASTTLEKLRGPTRALRAVIPGVYKGFGQMHDAALADGALDRTTKELIALTIAVVKGCESWARPVSRSRKRSAWRW